MMTIIHDQNINIYITTIKIYITTIIHDQNITEITSKITVVLILWY